MQAIQLDDQVTWPTSLQRLVGSARQFLERWYQRESQIDQAARIDVDLLLNRPRNVDSEAAEQFVLEAEEILTRHSLICYHCTRLRPQEVSDIELAGLRPLSHELIDERVAAAVSGGDLTHDEGSGIRNSNQAKDKDRFGLTFWIHGCEPLRDESGVGPLLGSWGGEAIYMNVVGPGSRRERLTRVGTAAIVEAEIPYEWLEPVRSIPHSFREALARRVSINFEAATDRIIPPQMIRAVIQPDSLRFQELTECADWNEPPT